MEVTEEEASYKNPPEPILIFPMKVEVAVDDPMVKYVANDSPFTVNSEVGVLEPTPIFPFERIANSDAPVEDATLNGLTTVEDDDCTLRANEDDVALIPATVPLSIDTHQYLLL